MYYVAWWCSSNWGEVSEVYSDVHKANVWIAERCRNEHVERQEIVSFESRERAEDYRRNGK